MNPNIWTNVNPSSKIHSAEIAQLLRDVHQGTVRAQLEERRRRGWWGWRGRGWRWGHGSLIPVSQITTRSKRKACGCLRYVSLPSLSTQHVCNQFFAATLLLLHTPSQDSWSTLIDKPLALRNWGPVVKWLTHWTLNPKIRVRVSAGPNYPFTFGYPIVNLWRCQELPPLKDKSFDM